MGRGWLPAVAVLLGAGMLAGCALVRPAEPPPPEIVEVPDVVSAIWQDAPPEVTEDMIPDEVTDEFDDAPERVASLLEAYGIIAENQERVLRPGAKATTVLRRLSEKMDDPEHMDEMIDGDVDAAWTLLLRLDVEGAMTGQLTRGMATPDGPLPTLVPTGTSTVTWAPQASIGVERRSDEGGEEFAELLVGVEHRILIPVESGTAVVSGNTWFKSSVNGGRPDRVHSWHAYQWLEGIVPPVEERAPCDA